MLNNAARQSGLTSADASKGVVSNEWQNMSHLHQRKVFITVGAVVVGALGYAHGTYESYAIGYAMRAKWGWICDGDFLPLAFIWMLIGGVVGAAVGAALWRAYQTRRG
jgi:hypothetical protein